jgi:hypothetical protein
MKHGPPGDPSHNWESKRNGKWIYIYIYVNIYNDILFIYIYYNDIYTNIYIHTDFIF